MSGEWVQHFAWIAAAAGLGFLIAALFAGRLKMRRWKFLIPYVVLSGVLFRLYIFWSETDILDLLTEGLLWGTVAAVLIGAFMVFSVKRQPASRRLQGSQFAVDLLWSGLVYGSIDALLLGVLPVLATMNAFAQAGWGSDLGNDIVVDLVAIASSALVTMAYHAGYPEFRNRKILMPTFALALGALGYVVTGSPVPVLLPHIAMHIASVVHGPEGTVQLPPHYKSLADSDGAKT